MCVCICEERERERERQTERERGGGILSCLVDNKHTIPVDKEGIVGVSFYPIEGNPVMTGQPLLYRISWREDYMLGTT